MTKIAVASFTDAQQPVMSEQDFAAYRNRCAARHSEARQALKKLANEGTTLIWKINAASRLYDNHQLPAGSIDSLAKELQVHQKKLSDFIVYWRRNFPNPGDAWRWVEVGGNQPGLYLEGTLSMKDINLEFARRLSDAFIKVGGAWVPAKSA